MSEDPCHRWRQLLGAYAMDRLPMGERHDVRNHLEDCDACTEALDEVLPVARLLPITNPERVLHKPVTPPEVANQLFAKIAAERRRRRRARYAGTSVVGLAAAMMAFFLLPLSGPSEPPGREVAFTEHPASVAADGRVIDQPWGTEIRLEVQGLSGRQTVWFERPDGSRASAGSFEGVDGGRVELVLSTAFKAAEAVALCISPPDQPATVRAPLQA